MGLEEKGIGQIETWAVVEVMGHNRYAGFVRSVSLGAGAMIRVDVPEIAERTVETEEVDYDADVPYGTPRPKKKVKKTVLPMPAYTKFLGIGSIFAITPCTEEFARAAVERFRSEPMTIVGLPAARQLPAPDDDNLFDEG